ncbi:MAG: type II toxin-antitoxin system RelE/ParE family toxin [Gammaproteobacteria bacterium]
MSLELRVRPEAEQDIEDAATWYEEQRLGLGQQFLDEVLGTFRRITEQSGLYPIMHRSTRRALTHRFPFGVFYRVEEGFIVVVAVMHGSQDPQRWKERT